MTQTSEPGQRTRVERYDGAAIESRWQQRWDELGAPSDRPRRRPPAEVLPPDDVSRTRRATSTSATGTSSRRPTRWPASTGCTATTSSCRSASTPSACRPRTPRSRAAFNPRDWTMRNIDNMRRQFRPMGATFDWDARGRHLRAGVLPLEPVVLPAVPEGAAWPTVPGPPSTGAPTTGPLASEQVEGADRHCWRCGAQVEKRDLEQWFFRITAYADELLDFDGLDWPEPIKIDADELDRPARGRRGRLRDGAVGASAGGERSGSSRPGPTPCSAPRSWSSRRSTRSSSS